MWRALLSIVEYTQFKMDDKHQNVRVITAESDSKFVLDSCCCCIPLRKGCLILGYLQLVVLIISGLIAIIGIGAGIALFHEHSGSELKEAEYQKTGSVFIALSALILVLMIISLPFTIILLVGLHKERRDYVKYYLVFVVVNLVLHVIITIGKFAGGYAPGKEAPSAVISIILSIYFFLVLRSHYIKMGLTNNVPAQHYRDGQLMNTQKV